MPPDPYLAAWEIYHSLGPPALPFHDALARHLRHGAVIATPRAFILARPVSSAWSDAEIHAIQPVSVSPLPLAPHLDAWHIWLAAGDLAALLRLHDLHPLPWVTYCRRGSPRVIRRPFATIARHVIAQDQSTGSPAASAAHAAAGQPFRP